MSKNTERGHVWGLDGVVLVRPASFRRPRSTVICGLRQAIGYAAQGYRIDWEATEKSFSQQQGDQP